MNLHKNNKQVVILYAELPNTGIAGIALERQTVEHIGKSLDNLVLNIEKLVGFLDYYDVMSLAQNPKIWTDEIKSSSANSSN